MDIQPVPLTRTETLHNAFIDKLFANDDTQPEISPPSERKVQTTKELVKQLIDDYEVKHYLTLGNMSWEDFCYENHIISYEKLLDYGHLLR